MLALMILLVTVGLGLAMLGLHTYSSLCPVPIAQHIPQSKRWSRRKRS